jgi:hypothetical protein
MRQRVIVSLLLVCTLALLAAASVSGVRDDIVFFNTQSLKYNCPSCRWAKKCTRNCIKLSRADAIKRGGVPCKVCDGVCR